MWILTFSSSSNEPLVYVLKTGVNTLGRNPDNDIVLTDDSVSRWHAEIDCQADRIIIQDLGSKNGTFVNFERITKPQGLKPGDQIHIGQQLARLFKRTPTPPSSAVDDLSETKPRSRWLPPEPVDKRAALLFEVTNRLTEIPDLEEALQQISTLIRNAMEAEKCEVIQPQYFGHLGELGFSTTIARRAIEQRAAVVIPDPLVRTRKPLSKSARLLRIRTALCVPVLIKEEVAGLVYMYRTDPAARPFDQSDAQLAQAISHQAALTIQRSRLLEQTKVLEKEATTDSLTSLYNRAQTLKLAELAFQSAQSLQRSLTMLMLDIDNFKRVNDTYGHPVGDQVLRTIALRFRQQLRSIDLLGRYGGDEFVILLVDTGLDGAHSIAERLRLGVADIPVDTDQGALPITISIGIAALSGASADLASLIDHADKALYAAKMGGRNQVKASI